MEITENLIRKRAEHNDCIISTLEELSLHQEGIKKIENIDKWCRDLKILYLQNNLISKIENLGRLKKLEYVNFALNNIEVIENLEHCESLKKLDLTVNFVGKLSSLKCLSHLMHLETLYLTGNPCVDYDGYREYAIAILPHLTYLDGVEISKSERIVALQNLSSNAFKIEKQENKYMRKREEERIQQAGKKEMKSDGKDGRWYTDIDETAENDRFWKEETSFTPETRTEIHERVQKSKAKDALNEKEVRKPRRLVTDDGRRLNMNEPKLPFRFDDSDGRKYRLELEIYKYLSTDEIDIDLQPTYIKVLVKQSVFQLVFPDEIHPDKSSAQRSQITGFLLVDMPRVNPAPLFASHTPSSPSFSGHDKKPRTDIAKNCCGDKERPLVGIEKLEVDGGDKKLNLAFLKTTLQEEKRSTLARDVHERANSPDFVDNQEVPPLM